MAPYEADAQLAYLSKENIVDLVVTEDSDLLVFGSKKVLFKLDETGNGKLVELKDLGKANKNLIVSVFKPVHVYSCANHNSSRASLQTHSDRCAFYQDVTTSHLCLGLD